MLVAVQIFIVLAAIVLGARLGSIAIGFAGGLGVLALGITGVPVTTVMLDNGGHYPIEQPALDQMVEAIDAFVAKSARP